MENESFTCEHCWERLSLEDRVDLWEEVGDSEYYGHNNLCHSCYETLKDEFEGGISHIIGDESEDDFWDHENEDGPCKPH